MLDSIAGERFDGREPAERAHRLAIEAAEVDSELHGKIVERVKTMKKIPG